MRYLLDANVLIALAWPGHAFHERVQRWFGRNSAAGWATCPFTQAAFVQIVSNPAFSDRSPTPLEAMESLAITLKHPHHQCWPAALHPFRVLCERVGIFFAESNGICFHTLVIPNPL